MKKIIFFALFFKLSLIYLINNSCEFRKVPQEKMDLPLIMRLPYSWKHPTIPPSPSPPLMGKQMGVIETLGIAPLGYELDGKVKVFRLIAQPVEKTIVDERVSPDYVHLIPKKNIVKEVHHHRPIVQKIRAWGYNGATPEINRPVLPGETFTYEFTMY